MFEQFSLYNRSGKINPGKQSRPVTHWFHSDEIFNQLYTSKIQALSGRHWTPLSVSRKAADFLAAAYHKPQSYYTGIEQRKYLVDIADSTRIKLNLVNCDFIHGNFTQIDFNGYNHFYFYNSFYENLTGTDKIDNNIDYSGELYNYYNRYLFRQLELRPAGTRLATYHSLEDEIPPSYHIVGTGFDNLLKFWIKV